MPRRSSLALLSALMLGAGLGGCGGGDGANTSVAATDSGPTPAEVEKVDLSKAGAEELKIDGTGWSAPTTPSG